MADATTYSVYVLHNPIIKKLYIGYSSSVSNRLVQHQRGKSQFTSQNENWQLLFEKKCDSKSEAISLERKLKNWKNSQRILSWIEREKKLKAQKGSRHIVPGQTDFPANKLNESGALTYRQKRALINLSFILPHCEIAHPPAILLFSMAECSAMH